MALIIVLVCATLHLLHTSDAKDIPGFIFEDNRSQERYIPDKNGEMSIELSSWPSQLGICLTLFVDFNRYSSIVPIFDFRWD